MSAPVFFIAHLQVTDADDYRAIVPHRGDGPNTISVSIVNGMAPRG